MVRRCGAHWDEALELMAGRLRSCPPERLAVYMTSRGQPNENYYAAQKAARALGTNSIDSAARLCHAPSTLGLEAASGSTAEVMLGLARMLAGAETAVFVWSMDVTQHSFGGKAVWAIVNTALLKGFVGREKCGLMPIRGHSGVQGGAELGAYATVFPGGLPINGETAAELSCLWDFQVPSVQRMTAPEMVDAAAAGRLDVLITSGGNFTEVLPDPGYALAALERVPLRVHLDIVLSSQMLAEPAGEVVLLPAQTRYEMEGGVTETSTERRVIYSPEIPGPRLAEARPEWEVFMELAKRARPDLAPLLSFSRTAAIREEIARMVPGYALVSTLKEEGDQFQYGGPLLCQGWQFPTPDGKAHFGPVELPLREVPPGSLLVTTRRGRQSNSMVQGDVDPHTGASRSSVLISDVDARDLAISDGTEVVLRSQSGR